jgi:hypothetical protein
MRGTVKERVYVKMYWICRQSINLRYAMQTDARNWKDANAIKSRKKRRKAVVRTMYDANTSTANARKRLPNTRCR